MNSATVSKTMGWSVATLIGVAGLVLSVFAAELWHRNLQSSAIDDFEDEATRQASRLEQKFEAAHFLLNTFEALYAASTHVTEHEFGVFTEALFLHIGMRHSVRPAIKEFGWIQWTPSQTQKSFLSNGNREVVTIELLPEAQERFSRIFSTQIPDRRNYFLRTPLFSHHDQSADSRTVVLIEPVIHKQVGGAARGERPLGGKFIRAPKIQGFVFVTVDIDYLIEAVNSAESRVPAQIIRFTGSWPGIQEDLTLVDKPNPFGAGEAAEQETLDLPIAMADLPFLITFAPSEPTAFKPYGKEEYLIVFCGLLLTGVTILYLLSVARQNQAFRQAKQAAERSNEQQSRFLANMSHELRTPISGIVGMTKLIAKSKLGQKERVYLNGLIASAESLLAIINDILDFSKIESNQLELCEQPTDIAELLRSVGTQFVPAARDKGIKLKLRFSPNVAPQAKVDPLRLRQVLSNLIGNAVKFTEEGQVIICVEQIPHPENPTLVRLVFAVRDTGVGIGEEAQSRIFERFTQADVSTTKKFGGTGLGLAISRQLVAMMSGEIGVRSQLGEGTEFNFWIPVLVVPATQSAHTEMSQSDGVDAGPSDVGEEALTQARRLHAVANPPPQQASPVGPSTAQGSAAAKARDDLKVLLVEDDPINRLYAEAVLRSRGCRITVAINGIEGVEAAKAEPFDLILMDCQMPVLDGFEASQRIASLISEGAVQPVPVVALTANALKGDRERCLAAGMTDYLTKPLDERELSRLLRQLTKGSGPQAEAATTTNTPSRVFSSRSASAVPEPLTSTCLTPQPVLALSDEGRHETSSPSSARRMKPSDSPDLIDREALASFRARMKTKFPAMVSIYLEDTERYIREIAESFGKGELSEVIRPAHTIKSSSRIVGATAVSKLAADLEALAKSSPQHDPPAADLSAVFANLEKAFALTRPQLN